MQLFQIVLFYPLWNVVQSISIESQYSSLAMPHCHSDIVFELSIFMYVFRLKMAFSAVSQWLYAQHQHILKFKKILENHQKYFCQTICIFSHKLGNRILFSTCQKKLIFESKIRISKKKSSIMFYIFVS